MRLILPIAACAVVLAGCANDYDKSVDANCKRPPVQEAQWELVSPSVVSLGMDIQTKKRLGIDSPNRHAVTTTTCVHNGDNGGQEPKIRDLQKVGAASLSAIESRL